MVPGPDHLALGFQHHAAGLERRTDPQCAQIAGDALVTPSRIAAEIVVDPQDVAGLLTAEFTRPQQTLHRSGAWSIAPLSRRPSPRGSSYHHGVSTAVIHIQIAVVGIGADLEALTQRHIHTKAGAIGAQVVVVVQNRRLISPAVAAVESPRHDTIAFGQILRHPADPQG